MFYLRASCDRTELLQGSGFSLPLAFITKCKTFFHFRFASSLHRWTTFFWSHWVLYHRNTNARTYLSWTRACWHSLIMYVLCCCTCPNTSIIITTFSICLTRHTKSLFGNWFKILNIEWKFFAEHFQPIIYNDRGSFYYFLRSYIRRRHWVLFYFFTCLSPFFFKTLQDFQKRSCTYLWQGECFLNWKDNWFVVNFSHPILGRTFLSEERNLGCSEVNFYLLWFVLQIKYFPFYKLLCFYWLDITQKIIYLENNNVWNYMHVWSDTIY